MSLTNDMWMSSQCYAPVRGVQAKPKLSYAYNVATMSRHSDSSFQRQGRPGGCHRPPLAGLIAQHGGRGVLRRQLYADFLVCVVVVLLALLRGGESMSRLCRDILTAPSIDLQ